MGGVGACGYEPVDVEEAIRVTFAFGVVAATYWLVIGVPGSGACFQGLAQGEAVGRMRKGKVEKSLIISGRMVGGVWGPGMVRGGR